MPLYEGYKLEKDEWKYDVIPEIMDGMNIYDYVDPDIAKKIQELEEEENNRIYIENEENSSDEENE